MTAGEPAGGGVGEWVAAQPIPTNPCAATPHPACPAVARGMADRDMSLPKLTSTSSGANWRATGITT
eukprot:scaffold5545_cov111-Isochrysis_galbana.AAC.6